MASGQNATTVYCSTIQTQDCGFQNNLCFGVSVTGTIADEECDL
jgi:hypothetical protein